ncbi:hypothetical protein pb186bvf_011120 [Paramecium bursaria]
MSNIVRFLQNQIQQLSIVVESLTKELAVNQSSFEQKLAQQRREMNQNYDAIILAVEQNKHNVDSVLKTYNVQIHDLQENKMDQNEAFKMMEQNRFDILEDVGLLKNEISYQKKHFDDLNNDKLKRKDMQVFQDQINQVKDLIKIVQSDQVNQNNEQQQFIKQLLNANKKAFFSEIDRLSQTITHNQNENEGQFKDYINKQQLDIQLNTIQMNFEQKADLIEVQNALNTQQADLAQRLQEFQNEVKQILEITSSEFFTQLNRKANHHEFIQLLSQKADIQQLNEKTQDKLPIKEFKDHLQLVEGLAIDLDKKLECIEFQEFAEFCKHKLEENQQYYQNRISKKEVKELIEKKSNHEDVAKAFQEVQQQLAKRLMADVFTNFQKEQAMLNDSLCSENILARWQFKGQFLSPGSLVPWNNQIVNTLTENFLWEKDKPNILVVAPGFYEIKVAFFAKKKPKIDIMINGETVIGAINNTSYVVHHSSGKLKDIKSSITGLSMFDFIQLPARARINVAYQGDLGEGFLSLRRL